MHDAQEYGYLMCAIMVLANLGVQGLPSGPLSDCPCCWAAGENTPLPGINVDFCFALCHLARCGTAGLQLAPPNQRLFLNHHPGTGDLLKTGADSSVGAQAQADASCSDFDAAKVLGRTDEKVGKLGRQQFRLIILLCCSALFLGSRG